MIARLAFAAALCVVGFLASVEARAASPSFDCAKAGNWAEKQICKNDELAALDGWFGPLYGQVVSRLPKSDADALRADRKAWLKDRNACKDDKDGVGCIRARYQDFVGKLEQRLAGLVGGSEVSTAAPATRSSLEECSGGSDVRTCLEGLLGTAETDLTNAEGTLTGEGAGESNVAWRAYRNAECKRRQLTASGETDGQAVYSACLIDLTRQRLAELQPK